MSREDPQMKIRLPETLKASIEAAATGAGRSLNAEIISRLDASFDPGNGGGWALAKLEHVVAEAAINEAAARATLGTLRGLLSEAVEAMDHAGTIDPDRVDVFRWAVEATEGQDKSPDYLALKQRLEAAESKLGMLTRDQIQQLNAAFEAGKVVAVPKGTIKVKKWKRPAGEG